MVIRRYGVVPDSSGPGRRGSLAFTRESRLRGESPVFTLRPDRRQHPPYGLAGGLPGAGLPNVLNPSPNETGLPTVPMHATRLRGGDAFRHVAAAGGPLLRDPQAVHDDVLDGKTTPMAAACEYGVVIASDGTIDHAATDASRVERGRSRTPGEGD